MGDYYDEFTDTAHFTYVLIQLGIVSHNRRWDLMEYWRNKHGSRHPPDYWHDGGC